MSPVSRRTLLRGAGVALALPWLESLTPRASADVPKKPKRFVAIYLPNGAPDFFVPPAAGVGNAWQLSSILDPLAALKAKVTVISGLENGSVFNADGNPSVQPSHGRDLGGWLTCNDSVAVRKRLGLDMYAEANGISLDQVMAQHSAFAGRTPLPSLQIGLSTVHSSCDGTACSLSRSISWSSETTPMFKLVNPADVFDLLVGALPGSMLPLLRRDERKSVLDAVQETAAATRARLSASDKLRMDGFLASVRSVEKRVVDGVGYGCPAEPTRPTIQRVTEDGLRQNSPTYDRRVHADLMNELLALALQCDQTRIASYMLDDERSEFVFDFLPKRKFTPLTSVETTGFCPEWHGGGQSGYIDDFATIVRWNVSKVAELCQRLAGMDDGDGQNVLDNSVIYFGSGMQGRDHSADRLPAFCVGGGGNRLKTDQHLALTKRPLRDFYFTLLNGVYDLGATDFGVNRTGAPISMIEQLLA